MLVFFVILAFAAETLCEDVDSISVQRCPINEVYVKCRQLCPPLSCNISYTSYARCDPNPPCVPGCDCIENYLRNDKGECILNDDCPPGPIQCGENQMPSDCADNYSAVPQAAVCRPGCRCVEGFTRNSYDQCVPKPPAIECGENEEASACRQSCPPQTCAYDPTKYACKPGPCQPGCNCVKGYKRNDQGICIPEEKCPTILPDCPENEEPTDCIRGIGISNPELVRCRPCQCIENYVRNSEGVCVSKEKLCKGDRNTTYTQCPNRCLSTCKAPNGICTQECREGYGCQCSPGYLLNDDGKCILPEDCPGGNPCGENQAFIYCNAGCPTANCPESDSRAVIACSQPYPCPSGCVCKRNYRWASAKREKCILASECPAIKCTRPNEIFEPCPGACFTDSCRSQTPKVCNTLIAVECQPQCVCKKNYRRNDFGVCVPTSECPAQCGKYEEYSACGDHFPPLPRPTTVASPRISCLPGCKCIEGYVRNIKGICVQGRCGLNEEPNYCIQIYPSNCPRCRCISGYQRNSNGVCEPSKYFPAPVDCPRKNEVNNSCPSPCYSEECGSEKVEPVACNTLLPHECQPRCVCRDNYRRDSNGDCIPKCQCRPTQCGEKQMPSDCADNYSAVPQAAVCRPGCSCVEGFTRNSYDECVPKPPVIECGENEEASACRQSCPPQTCAYDPNKYACKPGPCQPGCICVKGYKRNDQGICIPEEKCPTILPDCPENEEPTDCIRGIGISNPELVRCIPCQCIEDYERNSEGVCVPKPPVIIECGENEEASACRQSCPPQTCAYDPIRYASCRPDPCQPGCNCVKGYKRNDQAICIPEEKCPTILPECPKNEEPTDCIRGIGISNPELVRCIPCQCIENYVRNSEGVCVSKDELCKGDRNTTYTQCPNQCLSTCKAPNGICTQECREGYGCQCSPGYLLNDDGKCILPEDCPGGNPCGENQAFIYCNAGCPTDNCPESDSRAVIACSPPYPCPSGCVCKRNYRWASAKREKCILASECPAIECTRPNETFEPCPGACFTDSCRSQTPKVCNTLIAVQCQPQCVCKENYRRNDFGFCVPTSECPAQCGKYEEYSACGDHFPPRPRPTTVASPRISCLPGCKCIDGYVRNSEGICVQEGCGLNEEPNYCIQIYPSNCPRCRCISGYQRNSDGVCEPIPTEPQCPKYEEPNECVAIYQSPDIFQVSSTPNADPTVSTSQVVTEDLTVVGPIKCSPCRCIQGYVRNTSGSCVPIEAGCNGDLNATYTECPNQCVSTCKNPNAICSEKCAPYGCGCKAGYILSDDTLCIYPQDCPGGDPCGQNKTYVAFNADCPSEYCPKDDSRFLPAGLPLSPCVGGCACKRNYQLLSYEDQRCILASECPPVECTRKNEVYKSCPSACYSEECGSEEVEPLACNTLLPHECQPRCVCRDNYRRDSNGDCIPKCQCPPVESQIYIAVE